MKIIIQLFFIQLIFLPFSVAQTISIQGQFNTENKFDSIYLAENIGGKYAVIQSALINQSGQFQFTGDYPTGYYAIWRSHLNYAQIIINNEDIQLQFNDTILRNSIHIIRSKENSLLWTFIDERKKITSEISQAYMHKTEYVNKSKQYVFYDSLEKKLKNKYRKYLLSLDSAHPNSFLTKTILSDIETYKNEDFFKFVDFSDENLIRSGVLTKKITDYLQFKTDYTEDGFIQSIDKILQTSIENKVVYEFVLNYLLELFNAVGPDVVLNYLVEAYVIGDACTDLELSSVLNHKLSAYKRIAIGKKAPNISAFDVNGTMHNLYDVCSFFDINILYFSSYHCSFCKESTPMIIDFIRNNSLESKIQMINFSLDTEIREWKLSNQNKPNNWISLSELKGWNSKSTEIFQVHKTPSFYIIDRSSKIISKPKNTHELIEEIALMLKHKKKTR